MGEPARKRETSRTAARPRLRVVSSTAKSRKTSRASAKSVRRSAPNPLVAAALTAMVALSLFGLVRVWCVAQAGAAERDSASLRTAIEQERYRGDMLDVTASKLGSYSRVRDIATQALGMVPAGEPTYVEVGKKTSRGQVAAADAASSVFLGALAQIVGVDEAAAAPEVAPRDTP